MSFALRLILITLCAYALVESAFTKRYAEHKKAGTTAALYDARTFGATLHPNPQTMAKHNREYRDYVNSNVKCEGPLCGGDGKFSCSAPGKKNCYHVEHIFDKTGQDFSDCVQCKNIYANMVMADGKWNSVNGGLAGMDPKSYLDAQQEKIELYGYDSWRAAADNIIACCQRVGKNYRVVDTIAPGVPRIARSERALAYKVQGDSISNSTDHCASEFASYVAGYLSMRSCNCKQYAEKSANLTGPYYDSMCDSDDCSCDNSEYDSECCGCDCDTTSSGSDSPLSESGIALSVVATLLSIVIIILIIALADVHKRYRLIKYHRDMEGMEGVVGANVMSGRESTISI
jgi:hypothetical protein